MLNSSAARTAALQRTALQQTQLVNARPIWLLRCSIRFYVSGSPPVAFARTDNSGRPIPRRHPLTLIVFPASSLARALRIDGLCVLARTI